MAVSNLSDYGGFRFCGYGGFRFCHGILTNIKIYMSQVGLSRARRLAQGQLIRIHTFVSSFPVQIDGEPWIQQPCSLEIAHHGQRISGEPLGHAAAIMAKVIDECCRCRWG